MDGRNRKFPVTHMPDASRPAKLDAASEATRIPTSGLVRISLDRLMLELGNPARPDPEALSQLPRAGEDA